MKPLVALQKPLSGLLDAEEASMLMALSGRPEAGRYELKGRLFVPPGGALKVVSRDPKCDVVRVSCANRAWVTHVDVVVVLASPIQTKQFFSITWVEYERALRRVESPVIDKTKLFYLKFSKVYHDNSTEK